MLHTKQKKKKKETRTKKLTDRSVELQKEKDREAINEGKKRKSEGSDDRVFGTSEKRNVEKKVKSLLQ
jgi:hypothetical protein